MVTVSFAIVIYESDYDKLILSIKSILAQKGIIPQIVISDDGSKVDNFIKLTNFFERQRFSNYKLLKSKTNRGTVMNLKQAIDACDYEIIRPLAPGDFILGENVIADWVEYMFQKQCEWSIGHVICYCFDKNGNIKFQAHYCHPQDVNAYSINDDNKARWNYVVCDDIAFGVSIIYKKSLIQKYINRIATKVIYAEDNMFRLMMFDGIIPAYYEENVIMYEYGEGISTSKSDLWKNKLSKDWQTTTNMMLEEKVSAGYKAFLVNGIREKVQRGIDHKVEVGLFTKRMTTIDLSQSVLTNADYEKCCIDKINSISKESQGRDIYIYGAGKAGMIAYEQLNTSLTIKGFVDRNAENIKVVNDLPVIKIYDTDPDTDYLIVCLFEYTNDFVHYLKQYQFDGSNCCFIPACKVYDRCIIESIENI